MLPDVQTGAQTPAHARDLAAAVPPLPAEATCELARDAFDHDGGLFAVAIVDAHRHPIGLINRFKFLERLASRFGRELVLKKPVTELMETNPLILDEATHIDELGTRLMSQQHRYVFDGFIVTRNGEYAGLGTGLDLIRALTERRHAELRQMALHDMLTGLPNRTLFERHLTEAVAGSASDVGVAVMFLDLDRFKEINDTFGHRFGDLVLCGVSQRLRAAVRKSDLVARLSGDEFAIVLPDIHQAEDAAAIAGVLLSSCGSPLLIEGREVVVSCSIGVAIHPQHGATMEDLIRAADTAQYHAKESRNSWQAYHTDMGEWRPATPGLSALRQALEQGQLTVHYQPIVSLASGEVHSVEALVRWPHSGGWVPAADIVTLAETSGLIVGLTEFVMKTALRQMNEWDRQRGRRDLHLAVNISAMQVSGSLVEMIDRLLEEAGFDPRRLDLELTERAAMRAGPGAVSALELLRDRGITLTLDDFGTGYSALSRLERLPIDAMKIDKAFLEHVDVEGNGVIARAIIAMAHALGLIVVGEGVESAAQLEFLRREGCEFAQGYLLGRPSAPELLDFNPAPGKR
jgi:diguanylate cyclase (GGDEF)-like protein